MCYKCHGDNSVIMKINDIIALLYTLSHLLHYYSNSRVGHHALLPSKHGMTLLYLLLVWLFYLSQGIHYNTIITGCP